MGTGEWQKQIILDRSWIEKIEYDIWYIDNWSLGLDIKILFMTLWVVLITREGVYGEDGVNKGYPITNKKEEKSNNK